jgi:hypothetical protein
LELDTTEAQQRQRLHPQFSFKIPQTSSVVTVSHSFQTIVVFRIIGSAVLWLQLPVCVGLLRSRSRSTKFQPRLLTPHSTNNTMAEYDSGQEITQVGDRPPKHQRDHSEDSSPMKKIKMVSASYVPTTPIKTWTEKALEFKIPRKSIGKADTHPHQVGGQEEEVSLSDRHVVST